MLPTHITPAILAIAALAALLCAGAKADDSRPNLKAASFTDVTLTDQFWSKRLEINRTVTLRHAIKESYDTGRIGNFEKAGGLADGEFEGIYFNDSDVYKLLEGAAYILAEHPDPQLDSQIDEIIAKMAAAQEDSGYLNTYYTLVEPGNKWTDLPVRHELYCAGHLFEAAVAHHQAPGKTNLLDVATKFADHIDDVFGDDALVGVPGHEEIELALVKLADATGEQRYFDLAKFFVDKRGYSDRDYCQDHIPVREQTEPVGHAVRAMYLYAAMADVAARTGDEPIFAALDRLWEDLTTRRMYITGGVGPSSHNEGFTTAYDLPNDSAYAETCAAIGLIIWAQRMGLIYGDAQYVDVLEQALYNGMISGVSMEGDKFFYVNPLASRGRHHRQAWFGCACCPPNVLRLLPQVGSYIYASSPEGVWVNLYASNEATVAVGDSSVTLTQTTDYPWDGDVTLTVDPDEASEFALNLRVPGWCESGKLKLNGDTLNVTPGPTGYVTVRRTWESGDEVKLKLDMPVRRVSAHPSVEANLGRVALMRGPIVYCLEAADNSGAVRDIALPRKAKLKAKFSPDLLGGVMTLRGEARRRAPGEWDETLYQTVPHDEKIDIVAIPYYAWDHREPGEMLVWIPEMTALAELKLPPTAAQEAVVTASHCHAQDAVAAVSNGAEPTSSADVDIPRFTWWDHRGTREWVRLTFDAPMRVSAAEVYWFDDTDFGQCRVPASWVIEYMDGDEWKPVEGASDYGVAKDAFNRVTFDGVETTAIQICVQLQYDMSGGILEWRLPGAK
ncbi:MAG TPA: glycoside hydrolase family 127 protein [Armatimonadota bacterium]|nr:glycoside hydrolase family 127 protein [Armatimonadota bacterium]